MGMTRRDALKAVGFAGAFLSLGGLVEACSSDSAGDGAEGGDSGSTGDPPAGGDSGTGTSSQTDAASAAVDSGGGVDGGGGDAAQDTGAPDSGSTCLSNGAKNGTMFSSPDQTGHTLVVPPADVQAGVSKTYSIKGASQHPHSITLSAADFTKLQQGMSVTVKSTTDANHSHMVPVICG